LSYCRSFGFYNNPDGFLIKMRRTETSKTTDEAIELELVSDDEFVAEEGRFRN
jgi:hypothetical protein